ncbi:hypothetical protein M3Y99_01378300 [Aphelenchoides fujianensis]|nr:hypothetical protein M3Y99_01378300 [Aphelenchoides fujianensis]
MGACAGKLCRRKCVVPGALLIARLLAAPNCPPPPCTSMSTTNSCPLRTPANTLVGTVPQPQTTLKEGWGFGSLWTCLPLWAPRNVQLDGEAFSDHPADVNENYEISLGSHRDRLQHGLHRRRQHVLRVPEASGMESKSR